MPDFGDGSPRETYGARNPDDVSLSPEAYAEYQKKRKRDAILGILGVLGMTTGLGAAGAAFGGAAGGAMASVPGAVGAEAAPLGVGSVTAGAAGLPSGVGTGLATTAAGGAVNHAMNTTPPVNTSPGTGGTGFLGLSPRDWAALGLTGASTIGGAISNNNNDGNLKPNTQTTDPNLMKLIASMQGRMDQSEPLYKSIMAMANGLLPMQYQNGGAGPTNG